MRHLGNAAVEDSPTIPPAWLRRNYTGKALANPLQVSPSAPDYMELHRQILPIHCPSMSLPAIAQQMQSRITHNGHSRGSDRFLPNEVPGDMSFHLFQVECLTVNTTWFLRAFGPPNSLRRRPRGRRHRSADHHPCHARPRQDNLGSSRPAHEHRLSAAIRRTSSPAVSIATGWHTRTAATSSGLSTSARHADAAGGIGGKLPAGLLDAADAVAPLAGVAMACNAFGSRRKNYFAGLQLYGGQPPGPFTWDCRADFPASSRGSAG